MHTKIKNEKHIAILGIPYTADTMSGKHTYKKGHRANVKGMFEYGGEYVVEGHGIGHVIPRANFTKFIRIWDEVTTTRKNGTNVTKAVHFEVDETPETLAWFAELDAKTDKTRNSQKRGWLRAKIADLRKSISDVKSGKAQSRLAELLAELDSLRGK